MKKCKVYLKDVECLYCGHMHDELRADGLYGNWNRYEGCAPELSCRCGACGLPLFFDEKHMDFGGEK